MKYHCLSLYLAILRNAGTSLPVQLLLKENARLEGKNLTGGDCEGFAGLGVAPRSVVFLVDDELAEAGYLDFFTGSKGILQDVQYGLHDLLGFFSLDVTGGTDVFDKVFFGHSRGLSTRKQ